MKIVKKNYKVKVSGGKIKVATSKSTISIDMNTFAVLKLEQKAKQILVLDGDEVYATIDFDNVADAKDAQEVISKKTLRKNKTFRTPVFIAKILLAIFAVYFLLNLTASFIRVSEQNSAIMREQAMRAAAVKQSDMSVYSDIDKAKGVAMPVEDIFSMSK
ncbi:MAG: hypothetical protein N4A43_04525 [Alphaproteobacteria bacterium]|jgi:hypothetical protein|nr:hypothetical protein [Alphaproteobacteria bacterium]